MIAFTNRCEEAKKDHRLAQALRPTRARAVPVRVCGCEQGYLRGSRLPSRRSPEAQSEALAGASASSPSREKPASWSISSIVSAARSAELSAAPVLAPRAYLMLPPTPKGGDEAFIKDRFETIAGLGQIVATFHVLKADGEALAQGLSIRK